MRCPFNGIPNILGYDPISNTNTTADVDAVNLLGKHANKIVQYAAKATNKYSYRLPIFRSSPPLTTTRAHRPSPLHHDSDASLEVILEKGITVAEYTISVVFSRS